MFHIREIRHLRFCVVLVALAAAWAFAQDGPSGDEPGPQAPNVPVKAVWHKSAIPAGGSSELAVVFDVPKGHHITDVEYELFFVHAPDTFGLHFDKPNFPAGVKHRDERAYRGRAVVKVPVTAEAEAQPGKYSFPVNVGYQICQEFGNEICFLPVERTIMVNAEIVSAGVTVLPENEDIFGAAPTVTEEKPTTLEGRLLAALNRGSWLAFLLVFVGGILTSFTPCVYPIIPITIGYIGGASTGKPLRGLGLSAIFVLGIAVVYSSLGLVSAATGTLFGSISGSPWVTVVVAGIFAIMGISMLGAFDIALPSSMQTKLQTGGKGGGLLGPLVIGMVSGLVMAPCVGPVIVALLAWVAQTHNLLLGWALLFVFSLGLGLLFLVIGTFAGAIQALPRAGGWMETVKKGFGWILLAAALYLLRLMIPEPYYSFAWAVLLIFFAVFAGAFDSLSSEAGTSQRVRKAVTLIIFLIGAISLFKAIAPGAGQIAGTPKGLEVSWIVNEEEKALELARNESKPMIVDVYADWCVACVELDKKTYSVPEVAGRVDSFVRLKLDFTKKTPWVKEMMRKYQITGMPTVILFAESGDELGRFTGFKPPKDFLSFLDQHSL